MNVNRHTLSCNRHQNQDAEQSYHPPPPPATHTQPRSCSFPPTPPGPGSPSAVFCPAVLPYPDDCNNGIIEFLALWDRCFPSHNVFEIHSCCMPIGSRIPSADEVNAPQFVYPLTICRISALFPNPSVSDAVRVLSRAARCLVGGLSHV